MSNDTERRRPNVLQYIAYSNGRVLPDSMQDWVRNDLAGKGATARTMIRAIIALGCGQVSFARTSSAASASGADDAR